MPTLEELINAVPDAQATEDALLTRALADIRRQGAENAQSVSEGMFARGLGLSTRLQEMLAKNTQAEADAITKARGEAFNAAQQARLAALGQAANYDLRQRALSQQAKQGKQALGQQKANMWMQAGTGLGKGALDVGGQLFGPKLKQMVQDFIGTRPGGPSYGPASNEMQGVGPGPVEMPEIAQPEITPPEIAMPSLEGLISPSAGDVTQGFDWSSLDMPQLFSTGPSLQDLLNFNDYYA